MLDGSTLTKKRATRSGLLEVSKFPLARFIGGDGHGAPVARSGQCALGSQRAGSAGFGVELDGIAGFERLHLPVGAGDGLGAQVDFEVALGEQAGAVRALSPWFGQHRAPRGKHIIDDGAVDVGAVDIQFHEPEPLALDVVGGAQFLGPIRRRHGAGDDRRGVQVACDVLLVAIEALGAALAAVTHLAVVDRDATVGCDALPDARRAVLGHLQVLGAHLHDGVDVRAQGLAHNLVQVAVHPSGSRCVSFDTNCTMLRAAWPRRLIVSSTLPAPAKGRLSIAARNALESERPSPSVIAPDRTRATVRSSSTRSMSWAIIRSRNASSPPCEKGGVLAPRQSRTICQRRSTKDNSTASASEAPT